MVDELVVLATPMLFRAVGAFYEDFRQVSDDEVVDLLKRTGAQRLAEEDQRPARVGLGDRPRHHA
jgi:predicted phosphoribosyltransferase